MSTTPSPAPSGAEHAPSGNESAPDTSTWSVRDDTYRPDPPGPQLHRGTQSRIGVDGLKPVSEKLIPVRYLGGIVWNMIGLGIVVGCVITWQLLGWWWMLLIALLPLILVVQRLALTPRRVRALGYADLDDALVIAHGIMFRTVTTIPYGRIQSVEIEQGPIERMYGLASISLMTAAESSEAGIAGIPGLPREEAERLRDLLTRRGVDLMAAL